MEQADDQAREIAELRDRLSRLSQASLRINESLDFDTVLQGVLDSACSLTGARYGVITLLDDSGQVQDFVTSGLTAEEHRRFTDLPEGMMFFQYLSNIQEPLRLRDFHSHIRSLGLPEFQPPMAVSTPLPFLAAPIRHLGESVGAFYVGEKDVEFTPEDEETLVMFASQAALVIANARRHRDEQRARADLETLIDTSPVGVLVFDAKTGGVTSVNREARRIVSGLHMPDGSAEQLLDMLTFRRADGREVSLEEFPLAQALSTGETVRAEEIVIEVPDGGSVTTLVNATPIRSEEGEVVSVVVTLQDMTPLEEMERLRAEFLGMVSHELRTPLTSIKGSAATLTEAASDLDPAEMLQFFRIIGEQADHMRDLIGDLLDVARIETGELSVAPAPADVASLVDEARSRFQSGGGRNNLRIDLSPELPLVMADGRRIIQVLNNLLSNAARHSHEASAIGVSAVREGYHVAVSVTDEGRGIAAERLPHLFRKFSRIDGEDRRRDIAGSGLGLAICKGIVEAHGGRIWAESDGPGLGARFTFTIPVAQDAGIGAANLPVRSRRLERERECILAVDDDPQTLRHVRDALTNAGYAPVLTGDPGGGAQPGGGERPPPGAAGPDAAGNRRHRVDAEHPRHGGRSGHLPVSLRPGRDHRQGLREWGRRLRGQALFADGACGEDQGGAAQAGSARMGRAVGTLRAGGADHRLRRASRDAGRASRAADGHRVRAALRAVGQRRSRDDLRPAAATGLGAAGLQRLAAGAHRREAAPPQAGRRCQQPHIHPQRASRRLPHGEGRGGRNRRRGWAEWPAG